MEWKGRGRGRTVEGKGRGGKRKGQDRRREGKARGRGRTDEWKGMGEEGAGPLKGREGKGKGQDRRREGKGREEGRGIAGNVTLKAAWDGVPRTLSAVSTTLPQSHQESSAVITGLAILSLSVCELYRFILFINIQ